MLAEVMTIGWTQNAAILEADERAWYIKAANQFKWSKEEKAEAEVEGVDGPRE